MLIRRFHLPLAATLVAAALTACGGNNDSNPQPSASSPDTQAAFVFAYGNGLGGLNSIAGLGNTAFLDSFDDAFLDAGYNKVALRDGLTQEAAAMAVSTELSSFPNATLSNAVISGCNAADVCTLTATLTNADVDTTTVTFTTQVKYSAGKLRLYGDQTTS